MCVNILQERHRVCVPGVQSDPGRPNAAVPLLPHHPRRVLQQTPQTGQEDSVSAAWNVTPLPTCAMCPKALLSESGVVGPGSFSYLQKHTGGLAIDLREECWQPLACYRASLLAAAGGEDAVSHVSSDGGAHPPGRSPSSKQKREGAATSTTKSSNYS